MKCNLILATNELNIRDFSVTEKYSITYLAGTRHPLSITQEIDEDSTTGFAIVIKGELRTLYDFLGFSEIPVTIIA